MAVVYIGIQPSEFWKIDLFEFGVLQDEFLKKNGTGKRSMSDERFNHLMSLPEANDTYTVK